MSLAVISGSVYGRFRKWDANVRDDGPTRLVQEDLRIFFIIFRARIWEEPEDRLGANVLRVELGQARELRAHLPESPPCQVRRGIGGRGKQRKSADSSSAAGQPHQQPSHTVCLFL